MGEDNLVPLQDRSPTLEVITVPYKRLNTTNYNLCSTQQSNALIISRYSC